MKILMTGRAWISYAQIYVESAENYADLGECFGGQQNGLCGAAIDGKLFLITGTHTGDVGFTVELHDERPPIDDSWEEIVEAPYRPLGEAGLYGWGGSGHWPLDLQPIQYRARYSARGVDDGHQGTPEDDVLLDHYLLQFWPAPAVPDQILKQTAGMAAYWHDFARSQPPPPTAEERAEAERQQELARERRDAELRLAEETQNWGGTLPSERLRALGWDAIPVAQVDRELLDALDQVDAGTQRAIARWSVRQAYGEARLMEVDWLADAVDSLDRGDDLPAAFDEPRQAFERMWHDPQTVHTAVTTMDRRTDNFSQQSMAMPALTAAYGEDPLAAVVDTVRITITAFGPDRCHRFLADLRSAFPALRHHG